MSKLDKKKELLTTLRATIGFLLAIILTLTAGLIKMYYEASFDILFYVGICFDIIFVLNLPIVIKYLVKNINEIEEL